MVILCFLRHEPLSIEHSDYCRKLVMRFVENQNYESTYKYLIDIEPIHKYTSAKSITELENLRDHVRPDIDYILHVGRIHMCIYSVCIYVILGLSILASL